MAGRGMAEGEGDGALRRMGANPGQPRVGRGPSATRGEMGGQERFLLRPQGEEAVVGEGRGRIPRDSVRRLDKSKSPHLPPGVYDVFGLLPVTMDGRYPELTKMMTKI